MSLADYQTLVADLVRDSGRGDVISDVQRDAAITAALAQYSADRPREVVVDVVSPGGQRIDVPAGFTLDSRLVGVEYPIGQIPASQLPLSEISIYSAPTGRQFDLPLNLAAGEDLRITYTAGKFGIDGPGSSIGNLLLSYTPYWAPVTIKDRRTR